MHIELKFDPGLYPAEAVMSTAYVFIDRCYVLLDKDAQGGILARLSAKLGVGKDALEQVAGEFQNELLGQALRQRLAQSHEKVREAIVARALFGAAPHVDDPAAALDPQYLPADGEDFLDDPLGIAVPWEEKYGKEPKP